MCGETRRIREERSETETRRLTERKKRLFGAVRAVAAAATGADSPLHLIIIAAGFQGRNGTDEDCPGDTS